LTQYTQTTKHLKEEL